MTTVVLCGAEKDDGVSRAMEKVLSKFGGVQRYNGRQLIGWKNGKSPRFLIYESAHIPMVKNLDGILIFKNSFVPNEREEVPSGLIPVLDAQNSGAAAVLKGTGCVAISCGMSDRDTLSVASIDYLSAVVSLQRDLKILTSQILEPHDITIALSQEIGVYPLLALCSVLLLSGESSVSGYQF